MSLRRRIGPVPRLQREPWPRPGHARGLAGWERLVFGVVLVLLAVAVAVVAVVSMLEQHAPGR